jgi:hypothetical protein
MLCSESVLDPRREDRNLSRSEINEKYIFIRTLYENCF